MTASLLLLSAASVRAQQPLPSPPPPAPANYYVRPDRPERVRHYFDNMFGPKALAKRTLGAGISTWRSSPPEWGGQWKGFGKRFASSTGKSIINHTAAFALDEAFKLDSRYYHSSGGAGAKFRNAIVSPFVERNSRGKRVFAFPRFVGTYAASVIAAETWYPARYSWKAGMRSGTISLGTSMLFNVVREFIRK